MMLKNILLIDNMRKSSADYPYIFLTLEAVSICSQHKATHHPTAFDTSSSQPLPLLVLAAQPGALHCRNDSLQTCFLLKGKPNKFRYKNLSPIAGDACKKGEHYRFKSCKQCQLCSVHYSLRSSQTFSAYENPAGISLNYNNCSAIDVYGMYSAVLQQFALTLYSGCSFRCFNSLLRDTICLDYTAVEPDFFTYIYIYTFDDGP